MTPSRPAEPSSLVGPVNRNLGIFLVSVLGLFLEMLLIRWIGTEIRIFAYLQNTILIVCFLGLGLGCFTCRQEIKIQRTLIPLLCLTAILAIPFTRDFVANISTMLSSLDELVIWEYERVSGGWLVLSRMTLGLILTLLLMLLVCETFIPLGRLLGRYMDDHPRTIQAYGVNVGGSLIGIWLFALLSALHAPPVVWFAVAAGLLAVFVNAGGRRLANLAVLGAVVVTAGLADMNSDALVNTWSPYQKLTLSENNDASNWRGRYVVTVNNAAYQGIVDLSEEALRLDPPEVGRDRISQYDIPLRFKPQPKRVLIVGAGTGNDVAGALRAGAEHVTAVEIDPAIIKMGRDYHPEQPYASPRVTVVTDDARAFFETTDERFDLVIFGLLDSHTTTSMTNARLDHYVYTKESLSQARSLLTDDGVMMLTFIAQRPYIADRISTCLTEVFGRAPLIFGIPQTEIGWGGATFVTGSQDSINAALGSDQELAAQIADWQQRHPIVLPGGTEIAVDDWPYLYLEHRRIPTLHYLLGVMVLVLAFHYRKRLGVWSSAAGRPWLTRTNLHFFLLGAAFLLLEVQNISKASLVFGSTWIVNAVIISGILTMILLANLMASALPGLSQKLVGGCLIASCAVLYFVDLSQMSVLPLVGRVLVVGLLTTLPMFFAGIVFIKSFAAVERKNEALGANLLGALVGGLLESITFVIGVKALLLVVAGLYLAALATRPRQLDATLEEKDHAAEEPFGGSADAVGEEELVTLG
ncbi:Spermidine synthase [Posidoniimonas corsicana]|uniref:Spermidine synthase n=1 Tax=Posidoniimonas corsicana TaxID=1938618 RepID=A0A5C5VC38_9BACT|nr:methyltransferase domain-containing protein [Posidoniimonas corsicana]TWT35513.1 Spermidine synthase [Posidoniimonas corsicana]